jgi:hypothetical protein
MADVDLDTLRERMAATIEKAKADDPKQLRARVAELQKELRERPAAEPEIVEVPVEIEMPLVADEAIEALERVHEDFDDLNSNFGALAEIVRPVADGCARILENLHKVAEQAANPQRFAVQPSRPPTGPKVPPRPPRPRDVANGTGALNKAEHAFLNVLAQFPDGRNRAQLGMLTGYSKKSSHFSNTLSALRGKGWIGGSGNFRITADGLAALGDRVDPIPPPGSDLVDWWLDRLKNVERTFLQAIVGWPEPISRAQLAEASGYSATSSHFSNTLSRLRTLDLIEGSSELRATRDLVGE